MVEGEALDRDGLEAQLERLGDSLVVVGDETALKVHVHTDEPGAALSLGTAAGTIEGVEIANMHEQQERAGAATARSSLLRARRAESSRSSQARGTAPSSRRSPKRVGTIRVVAGGQTANPSTAELVAALEELEADEAIVLPNNSNVRLAAEHAAEQAGRPAAVVPTESIPAGLAALVAYDGTRSADENAEEMAAVAAAVATGEVTRASRDVELNGLAIRHGDWLGLADGDPVAGGDDFADVTFEVVDAPARGAAHAPDAAHGRRAAAARRARRTARVGSSRARGRGARGRAAALPALARRGIGFDGCRQSGSCSSRTTRFFAMPSSSCSG